MRRMLGRETGAEVCLKGVAKCLTTLSVGQGQVCRGLCAGGKYLPALLVGTENGGALSAPRCGILTM
jgi:hypothetical protein